MSQQNRPVTAEAYVTELMEYGTMASRAVSAGVRQLRHCFWTIFHAFLSSKPFPRAPCDVLYVDMLICAFLGAFLGAIPPNPPHSSQCPYVQHADWCLQPNCARIVSTLALPYCLLLIAYCL